MEAISESFTGAYYFPQVGIGTGIRQLSPESGPPLQWASFGTDSILNTAFDRTSKPSCWMGSQACWPKRLVYLTA